MSKKYSSGLGDLILSHSDLSRISDSLPFSLPSVFNDKSSDKQILSQSLDATKDSTSLGSFSDDRVDTPSKLQRSATIKVNTPRRILLEREAEEESEISDGEKREESSFFSFGFETVKCTLELSGSIDDDSSTFSVFENDFEM